MPPPGRGQAPPDPPACQGRPITLSTVVRCAVANPHLHGCTCAPIRVPAPAARPGEAAPRPYMVGRSGTAGTDGRHRSGDRLRPVGVRRCLTRRPARAGTPYRRRPPAWGVERLSRGSHRRDRPDHCTNAGRGRLSRRVARAGEAAPRPYRGMPGVPGRAFVRDGWAQSPSCRGQAVPDPPARKGRQSCQ